METQTATQNGHAPQVAPPPPPIPSPGEIKAYHRTKRNLHIAAILLSIAWWGAWVLLGDDLVGWVHGLVASRWPGLFVSAIILLAGSVLIHLPLDYYADYVVEQRYHLSNQTPRTWLIFQAKGWLVGGVIGGIVLGGLYALLWYGGTYWSVLAWAGMMVLSVGLAKLFPLIILPLFYPARPLDRPSLTQRLEQMAAGSGMRLTGVFDLELSKETRKANAMLAGLGSSRRVYLSDTLLASFSDDQISVVFAHELGHHVRKHIWKGIALSAVATSLMMALIHWRLNPYAGASGDWAAAVSAFPQVMLLASVFPLLIAPITNAISRRYERQCDSDALRLTKDPQAYRTAFEQLGRLNLSDPNPPRWEVILFDDHPPLSERIAMADQMVD